MTFQRIKQIIENYPADLYGSQKHYAVLLPLIEEDGQLHVLYEVRSQHISQPGETSFPGGRLEPGETYQEAAVRETCEELNLRPSDIEVYGEIDYLVNQSRVIHCFVGRLLVDGIDTITPNEEVDRVFSLSLDYLLHHEPTYYQVENQVVLDKEFPYRLINEGENYRFKTSMQEIPFYDLEDEILWGFTANLTHRFTQILKDNNYSE